MRAPHFCQVILLFSAHNILPRINLRRRSVSGDVFRDHTRAPPAPRHEIQDLATDRHSGIHPIQISPQHVTNDAAANGIFQFLTPKTAIAPDGKTELRRWPSPYRLSFSSDRIRSPAEERNFPTTGAIMTNMSGVSINTPMTVKILGCHRSAMKKQNEAANAEQAISSNSIMFTAVIAHQLTISAWKSRS